MRWWRAGMGWRGRRCTSGRPGMTTVAGWPAGEPFAAVAGVPASDERGCVERTGGHRACGPRAVPAAVLGCVLARRVHGASATSQVSDTAGRQPQLSRPGATTALRAQTRGPGFWRAGRDAGSPSNLEGRPGHHPPASPGWIVPVDARGDDDDRDDAAQRDLLLLVGTGDSTTVVVDDGHVLQVDLRDMALADEPDSVHAQVIDRLAEVLP